MANLISAEAITKSYGKGNVLDGVSLGIAASERIGVVGINGGGKSTLLKILAGVEVPDSGRYTQNNQLRLGHLAQIDAVDPLQSVREVLFGQQAAHDWATNPLAREVVMGLFGSLQPEILTKQLGQLSGGERRRIGLARLLISDLNLILLDEPTNHLDIQGISWLANHLKSRKNLAVVVITHDRWFLDEVADRVW
ncbi:MAG: ATP-binding cassette domain-containing protein, partial [Candidatus Nanopelagicales bacterium]